MRRLGRVNWRRIGAGLAMLPLMAVGAILIGASGIMSVTFGYQLGQPSGTGAIIAAVAIAIEGWADLSIPLLWHRLRLLGRLLLIGFFGLCLAYKLEASKKFAAENLGKREATLAGASLDYQLARDKVEGLRKAVNDNIDARAAKVIQGEIDILLRNPKTEGCEPGKVNGNVTATVCPKVDKLRGELTRAETRDRAQETLAPAIAALRNLQPVSIATTDKPQGGGPVLGLLALFGIVPAWSDLMSTLIMAVVELGAILVPLVIGFASGGRPSAAGEAFANGEVLATGEALPSVEALAPAAATGEALTAPVMGEANPPQSLPNMASSLSQHSARKPPRRRKAGRVLPAGETLSGEASQRGGLIAPPAGEAFAGESLPAGKTERDSRDLSALAAFLEGPCERQGGEKVQSTTLYFIYGEWHQQQGGRPMTMARFGTLLPQLGVARSKINGKNHYLGIRLRHPAQGGTDLPAAVPAEELPDRQAWAGAVTR